MIVVDTYQPREPGTTEITMIMTVRVSYQSKPW